MVWNQQRTLLECYEEPCLIGSELLNKAVENRKLLIPRSELPKTNEDDLGIGEFRRRLKDLGGLRVCPQKISHFGKVKKANRQKVLRKPKDFKVLHPGHTIALDTVEKQRNGRRMYILTAIDIFTRTTCAIATKSHSSKTFAHFFFLVMQMFPYEVKNVLTDNGSEFKKHLSKLLTENKITHYHTYPKTPKMNAHCESFNGTIQEDPL